MVATTMAHATNCLLPSKSLLLRLLISPLPRFCNTDTGCSQFVQTKPPTIKQALNILESESDPQKLVEIFKQSAEQPRFCRHRLPSKFIVKKLAIAKQFNAIEEILDHSLQVRKPCSESFISRIILLYGIAGMPQHATKTFHQMKCLNISPTVESFNALLIVLDSQNPKLALDLYKDIDSFGISADLQTYNSVVKAICEMGEHESACLFMGEMRKHGCEPDIVTYNTILSALYKQGRYKEGDYLFGKMSELCPPDVFTYNIRMSSLCGCNKSCEAETLLDEMVFKGLNPNNFTFNILISGFCRENNLTEAKRVFSDMSRKGCDQNAVNYYTLIYHLSKGQHFDTAYEIYGESMRKNWMPPPKTAKMLIDGLVKINKVENARQVIEEMKKKLPVFFDKELENI